MKVFVSAAEISSDIHAEKILRALQKKAAEQNLPFEVRGIGGPRLRSIPGFVPVENAENLRTMGFIEVLRKWTYFTNLISITAEQIHGFQPDLILTFDYPDFHFKLMETLQKRNIASQAVRICGIPPKVWVWRSKRVEKIRNLYHGVWVIFPFEKKFYQERGIPVIFEGNPLLEDLPLNQLTSVQKRPMETITVMPGSREGELDCHLPVIPEALELFSKKIAKPVIAMVPVPEGVDQKRLEQNLLNTDHVSYVFSKNDSARCLLETSIGLIKSGTSTLEASVLGCVPVIFYRMNWFSEKIFNFLIRGIGGYLGPVGLPNILLGIKKRDQSPFREFLGVEATPEAISNHLAKLYRDEKFRQSLEQKCGEVRSLFLIRDGASSAAERSSSEILKWMQKKPHSVFFRKPKKRTLYTLVSLIWSSLNFFRRRIQLFGLTRSHVVKTPSILVGNIQAGGAGKTPLIIALAKAAVAKGKKVAVISRGYGSSLKNPLGDEPQEIKAAVPEVILEVGSDRIQSIQSAESQKVDLILFDDGFQNLKFKSKTTVIAVTDRGRSETPYRDFDCETEFADYIIGTKGNLFRKAFTRDPKRFFQIEWDWNQSVSQPVWLLCGVADPEELNRFYSSRGLVIQKLIVKPDHAEFDPLEVKKLMEDARSSGCVLAITGKDAVKLKEFTNDVLVLSRTIRNQDWIESIFKSTMN